MADPVVVVGIVPGTSMSTALYSVILYYWTRLFFHCIDILRFDSTLLEELVADPVAVVLTSCSKSTDYFTIIYNTILQYYTMQRFYDSVLLY